MEASDVAATVAPAAPTTCLRDIDEFALDESALLAIRISCVKTINSRACGRFQMPAYGFASGIGTFGCSGRTH
jgi:hypothetical protein